MELKFEYFPDLKGIETCLTGFNLKSVSSFEYFPDLKGIETNLYTV